ncbi:MAG: efflux RND transporter periplasmic adaptor subunit [Nitrospirae bacterium]|nr:efflux RND transporter periplasmic adaptor subunit [Nitrospirota bacterium]
MPFYKKIRFWLLGLLILLAGFLYLKSSLSKIDVQAYEAGKKDLIISVTATSTGTIKADQEEKLTVQRTGRISRLLVEEGSSVEKGSLVAELDQDEVRQRLAVANAALQRNRANLEALRLNLLSLRTDVEVNISKTSSVLGEAEARFISFSDLKGKGYLSRIEYDAIKREYDIARANYASAVAAKDQIRSKEEEIRALQAAVRQSEGEYALAQIAYDYSFIKAPFAGVVTARPVKVGDTPVIGGLIASVVSPESLYIEAFIDEADVAKVSVGQAVNVSMDAYPGKTYRGEVFLISPVVLGGKQEARTFEVRVRLTDKDLVIKPGMSADVEVVVDRARDVLIVPSQAIVENNNEKFVYVVRGGRAVKTKVRSGLFNWSFVEITEGIREGDSIVITPDSAGLVDRARVRVTKTDR